LLNNIGLVTHCISKIGARYMFGFTGIVTETIIQQKARQYPRVYTSTYISKCRQLIGQWATDCSGLIDLYLGVDLNASGYYLRATRKGSIGSIPDHIPGILVFKYDNDGSIGHVGVSEGNGNVIEAKGIAYGVVRTVLAGNGWDLWAYCHLIEYITPEGEDVIKIGDKYTGFVKPWQEALLKLGISVGEDGADDWFGGDTEDATKIFQGNVGLPQTGIVDAATASKMFDALRLVPNVDVTPYTTKIVDLTKQVEESNQTISGLGLQIETANNTISGLNFKLDEILPALAVIGRYMP